MKIKDSISKENYRKKKICFETEKGSRLTTLISSNSLIRYEMIFPLEIRSNSIKIKTHSFLFFLSFNLLFYFYNY